MPAAVCWSSKTRAGYFWSIFFSSVLMQGGKQSFPVEGCLVAQGAARLRCCSRFREERPYGLSRLCVGLQLQLPVIPHLRDHHSPNATGLGKLNGLCCHDLRCNEVQVKKAFSAPTSLYRPDKLEPAAKMGQDSWKLVWMQELPERPANALSNRLRGSTRDLE